jgi:hypothetical protein
MTVDQKHPLMLFFYNTKKERVKTALVAHTDTQGMEALTQTLLAGKIKSCQVVDRNCSGNAYANKGPLQHAFETELHLACGGFGMIREDGTVWDEWGVDAQTVDEYKNNNFPRGKSCHFWLEDGEGRVFDVLQSYCIDVVAPAQGVKLDTSHFLMDCIVNGFTQDELRRAKLVYRPAAPDVQRKIIESIGKTFYTESL